MSTGIPAWVDGRLRPADKLDVHLRGLRHKAVSVFVIDGNAILLQKRAATKYHTPGLWANTCCTHPHWGEGATDCARRRLREEIGLVGLSPRHRGQVEYRADVGGGMTEHEVVDLFVAEGSVDMKVVANPDEVSEVRWTALNDLLDEVSERPETFTPWLRIYLAEYREGIFGGRLD